MLILFTLFVLIKNKIAAYILGSLFTISILFSIFSYWNYFYNTNQPALIELDSAFQEIARLSQNKNYKELNEYLSSDFHLRNSNKTGIDHLSSLNH